MAGRIPPKSGVNPLMFLWTFLDYYSCLFPLIIYTFIFCICSQKNARKVLKVIRAIPIGPTDSLAKSARAYSDHMELGTAGDMWTVKSESTGLPKSIVGSLYKTVFGNRLHVLEGGIEGTGLDSVLRRFAGPTGIIKQLMKTNGASWSWRDLINSQSSSSSRRGDRLRNFLGRVCLSRRPCITMICFAC